VVTTPVGCRAVFGIDPGSMLDRTEAVLRSGLDETDRGLQRCAAAVAALESEPARWPGPGSPRTWAGTTRRTRSVTSPGTPESPTAYVAAQRQFLDPDDDPAPGFVPEG
jgi:hypothetical protein